MSNNKQSSVEWLISQLQKSKDFQRVLNEVSQMSSVKIDIISEAKAMHKQECVDLLNHHNDIFDTSEEHYNKTFGGNNG